MPESSRESYAHRMNAFLTYMQRHNRPLDDTDFEDIQQYILYLTKERDLSSATINNYISAIKFFYTYVLENEWSPIKVPRMKIKQNFPVIPSREEIWLLINATDNLKHKAILLLTYGSGMRVSEVAKLKIGDISSKRMSIYIDKAKHDTNRYTILS